VRVKPPPIVLLLLAYGAGLATGLARFPDTRLAIPVLLAVVVITRRQELLSLLAAGALVGQLGALVAWRGEVGRCSGVLQRGAQSLVVVPIDPPPVARGRVEGEVVGAGCRGTIPLEWGRVVGEARRQIVVGSPLRVTGTWYPRPDGPFERAGGLFVVREVAGIPVAPVQPAHAARAALFAASSRLYGAQAPLVDALLFDRKGALDPELRDRFAASGLIHLLSISGFHVGLIVGWAVTILRLCRARQSTAWIGATLLGLGYVAWLGFPPPATRAAALAVVVCVAELRQRIVRWDSLLSFTALIVLLVDPWSIADLGAWLSVTSLAGATYATRWSDLRFGKGLFPRTLAGSVGATLGTAPITAGALGSVALAGLLLNFIGIPLAALALPAVIVSLLLAPIWPAAAESMAAGSTLLLEFLDRVAGFGAVLPYGQIVTESGWSGAWPWAVVLGAAIWSLSSQATASIAFLRASIIVSAAIWLATIREIGGALRPREVGELAITFLDVGQGDAAAIRTPNGLWILVDGGPAGGGSDAGRRVILPFLRRQGVARIEGVILSHAHLDHYGGLNAVLSRLPARWLLDPGAPTGEEGYRSLLDLVETQGTEWRAARVGDTLRVDGVELIVLHPTPAWSEWGLDLNEDSAVLLLRFGDFEALLTGDAGLAAERVLSGRVGDIELLKVGHHGSAGSSGAGLLEELRPEVGVISVGRGNRYRHPSAEALGRLGALGVEVWRTDEVGAVEVRTDGETFTVSAGGRSRVLPASPRRP
jgi:competence protein ComEC